MLKLHPSTQGPSQDEGNSSFQSWNCKSCHFIRVHEWAHTHMNLILRAEGEYNMYTFWY